jgi:hypothetical protein
MEVNGRNIKNYMYLPEDAIIYDNIKSAIDYNLIEISL